MAHKILNMDGEVASKNCQAAPIVIQRYEFTS